MNFFQAGLVDMNELFAVDPQSLAEDDGRYCKALYDRFGFHNGIFMAGLPSDWKAQVRRTSTTSLLSARCGEFLAQAKRKKFVLPVDSELRNYDFSEMCSRGLLAGVVGKRLIDSAPSISEVILDNDMLRAQRDAEIRTSPTAFIEAFQPLILTSSELHLIDKYAFGFARHERDLKESWYEFFRLVKALGPTSSKPLYRFVIHLWDSVSAMPSRERINTSLDELNSFLVNQPGPDLEIVVHYSDESVPEDQHDRFLLAAHGGLCIGWGLHFNGGESTTYVNYLSEDQLQYQHKKFISGRQF